MTQKTEASNNLKWLLAKAQSKNKDLTTLEFGKQLFPELKSETVNEIKVIQNKVNKYLKADLKTVPIVLMQRIADILETDFNEMFGYNKKE